MHAAWHMSVKRILLVCEVLIGSPISCSFRHKLDQLHQTPPRHKLRRKVVAKFTFAQEGAIQAAMVVVDRIIEAAFPHVIDFIYIQFVIAAS